MFYVIAALGAYLLGASNMAYYLAKLKKADLRAGGSGNLGASNATVLLGWKAGVLVGLHDIGKSALAVFLAQLIFPELPYIGAVAGVASVLGHIFPFYLKFRGGKGFASYIGMSLVLNWKVALAVLALMVILTVVTDYIVVGTMATVTAVPVALGILTHSWMLVLILLVASLVIVYKHRENFPRMLNGTELGLRSAIRGDNRLDKAKSEKSGRCGLQRPFCKEERRKNQARFRNSAGSMGTSWQVTLKWTWGPRAVSVRAVSPTVPMTWPRVTVSPAFTASSWDRLA